VTDLIRRTERDGVVELCLDRPEQRNALSTDLLRELRDHLDVTQAAPSLRAVIVTGAGSVFSAGADIAEFGPDAEATRVLTRTRLLVEVLQRLVESEQPTIAAVNGPAVGGGWGLALACDLCLVSDRAGFALPEVRKGYRLPSILMTRLIHVVGPVRAAHIAFGGATYTAEDAVSGGWAGALVPADALLDEAWALAGRLAGTARRAITAAKTPLRAAAAGRPFPPAELVWTEE
jgi:methylglutaconyl-CoA hydratase